MKKRLSRKNALYTSGSGTTVLINYDIAQQMLEVQFKSGDVYHYRKVPPSIWEEYKSIIQAGGSSGSFLNKQIKPFYEDEKILGD